MKIFTALFLVAVGVTTSRTLSAQAPQVPHKMQFAGITLTLRDDARKEIQKDVDALTQSPRHFNIKAERAKTYFPIIEKVFAEEGVPDDFKYLVLQESALIADAVSVSNAVGFWQFKDFTAVEMGMRVDREIDERMNIVSATRGAARYFKKNNLFFNNWLYSLQAYQMGAGGVMRTVKDSEGGATSMEINSKTYWYVKKYLAHKIAFEGAVSGPGQVQVSTLENKSKKSLADLAAEISVDEAILKSNNKWVKSGVIPDDRTYMVLIPVSGDLNNIKTPALAVNTVSPARVASPVVGSILRENKKINGLLTIIAIAGENPTSLALRAGVGLSEFLKWNDMSISDPVVAGQVFFLSKKRTRATTAYHTVLPGENLWSISQDYGVQLKRLRRYNRLESNTVTPGETLWLSAKRPKDANSISTSVSVAEVDNKETFNWNESGPVATADTISTAPVVGITQAEQKVSPVLPEELQSRVEVGQDSLKKVEDSVASIIPTPVLAAPKDSVISISVKKTEHVVQVKETLYGIAHLYNIGVMDLVRWNGLNLQDGIKPGQILKLVDDQPVSEDLAKVKEPLEIFHEVKASDTLYSVARKYGVTIKDLMEWNGKTDFNVTVGEKLKIVRR
jgi:membrane-bound lytic murein transglycosylase D